MQPAARTLDGLFARTARRFPKRIAVREGWHQLTYAQAERRAARLASALVHGGVQLGDPLIVHCANHRQALVAQLAVLKVGAACVPMSRPAGDLAEVVRASGTRAVLSSRATYDRRLSGVATLALDDPAVWRRIAATPTDPSLPRSGPDEAAHLILGERGPEEGRIVDHHSWWLSLVGRVRRAGVPHTVAIDEPPLSDVALAAMWWAFADGGTLHAAPYGANTDWPLGAGSSCAAMLSPTRYAQQLESAAPARASGPQARPAGSPPPEGPGTVVLLGDPCSQDLVARHFLVRPASALWAEFTPVGGPVPWTARRLSAHDAESSAPDVGSAVPPARVRVLGSGARNLPSGKPGELVAAIPAGLADGVQHSGWHGRWTAGQTLEITAPPPGAT